MRRKPTVRERMVEAAVELFADQGFAATTTRQIAHRARINEVSIYRHFSRKQKLFWTALQSRLECLHLRDELATGLAQDWDPEIVVPLMVRFLVQATTRYPELMRLLYISLVELGPRSERVYVEHMAPTFHAVREYFQRGAERGRLRSLDPSISVTAFLSTVLAHRDLHTLLTGKPVAYAGMEEVIAAYSSFWLALLAPAAQGVARPQGAAEVSCA